jgi:hypothetical protein
VLMKPGSNSPRLIIDKKSRFQLLTLRRGF